MLNDLYILQIQSLKGYKGKRTGIKSLSYLYPQDLVDVQQKFVNDNSNMENRLEQLTYIQKKLFLKAKNEEMENLTQ